LSLVFELSQSLKVSLRHQLKFFSSAVGVLVKPTTR